MNSNDNAKQIIEDSLANSQDFVPSEKPKKIKKQICNVEGGNNVADVAVSPETLTEKDFEAATFPATLVQGNVAALQNASEFYVKDDKHFYTKVIFVRGLKNETKEILSSWYPSHAIVKLPDNPDTLMTIPSFMKEVVIVSCNLGKTEKTQDTKSLRRIKEKGFAYHLLYLPEDLTLDSFLMENNQTRLKETIDNALSGLEISSRLPKWTNVADLSRYNVPEPQYVIHNILPATGVSIVSGHPKIGKSWLALNIAKAIERGEDLFGLEPTRQTGVLYLTLEDNTARILDRITKIYGGKIPPNIRFDVKTVSGQLNKENIEALKGEIAEKGYKFLIIDPVQKVKTDKSNKHNAYEADYAFISPLKDLAEELGICILLIHHLKKDAKEEDDIEAMNGSTGLPAACDSILTLWKNESGLTLKIKGKDVEERVLNLIVNSETWIFSINEEVRNEMRGLQGDILRCLQTLGKPCKPKEISDCLGKITEAEKSSVRTQLISLRNKKEVSYHSGFYSVQIATSATFDNPNVAVNVAASNQHEIRGYEKNCNAATFSPLHIVKPNIPPSQMKETIL